MPPNASVEKGLAAAEKIAKALTNQLNKRVRDGGLLDREFDQFGQNALKTDAQGVWRPRLRSGRTRSQFRAE